MTKLTKFLTVLVVTAALGTAVVMLLDWQVKKAGQARVVETASCPKAQVAIVPGAYVFPDGRLCDMLADRVQTAVELYHAGRVGKIIMTGDHGRIDYDEVNHMRLYAEQMGVPTEDIFMDHAGFSTYESMYRARDIFQVSSAVIVTQAFHLPRAVYTARALGIDAVGLKADKHIYAGAQYYDLREIPARLKAFAQVQTRAKPQFLGEAIPVTGDGRLTHDGQ